ncbi:MAG: HAMP domain-containing histidine kinase [Tannerella sp.]|nr:HAMP domain-containing histidine kinase [Tannerella sp.]
MKEANMFQQVLELMGKHIEINSLDSLFNEKLADIGISNDYLLVYKDSVGNIIEQIGELPSSKIDKAFHTDALLIVDGKRVQAIMDVTPDIVFRQMIWLLVASFLMLFVLVFCVIYQAKTIFTQYKLNRLREDFVHALTHDMKTPLSTINNVLSQFRSGLLDNHPDMKERFGEIGMDQVAGLQMLVEKILTIAKLERGRLLLERSDTDLPGIVKELKERFAFSKDDKQVTIRSSCDLKDCSVYLDTTLIKDAIGNLIENAVKYSGKSVVIDVDCYIMDDRLFIRIRDNGFGISLKDQQKIFEKFERGTAVSRKRTKGFGLGLNYVKHVTEAHGGIVTLYSMENRGSEFTLVLPLD